MVDNVGEMVKIVRNSEKWQGMAGNGGEWSVIVPFGLECFQFA